jgi:aryl carrier-like protein
MEVSVEIMRLPARWLVKPYDTDFTGLQPSMMLSSW